MSLPAFLAGSASEPLNPIRLFMNADLVVQVVMGGLLLASVWVWTTIIAFSWRMSRLSRRSEKYEAEFWEAEDI
jgi:biopolymer transport protein TolQ